MRQGEAWFSKEREREREILFEEEGHECPAGKTELLPEWRTNVVYYGEALAVDKYSSPPQNHFLTPNLCFLVFPTQSAKLRNKGHRQTFALLHHTPPTYYLVIHF